MSFSDPSGNNARLIALFIISHGLSNPIVEKMPEEKRFNLKLKRCSLTDTLKEIKTHLDSGNVKKTGFGFWTRFSQSAKS